MIVSALHWIKNDGRKSLKIIEKTVPELSREQILLMVFETSEEVMTNYNFIALFQGSSVTAAATKVLQLLIRVLNWLT